MFYYMHNNTNYQCKICWNKALTFGVCWIQLSFRIYHCVHPIHANMFSIQMLLHFSQIVPRVCTLVLSLLLFFLTHRYVQTLLIAPFDPATVNCIIIIEMYIFSVPISVPLGITQQRLGNTPPLVNKATKDTAIASSLR